MTSLRALRTTRPARPALVALVLATLLLASSAAAPAAPGDPGDPGDPGTPVAPRCGPAGGTSEELTVTGWVGSERTYDAAALAALPQTTVADTYRAGPGTTSANYTGVDLWRLLELPATSGGTGPLLRPSDPVGPQGPTQRNDVTRYSVMVTGSDCFQALYAMTEISPFFGGRPVVVATAQGTYAPGDTTPVTGSLGADGFARLSNPSDLRGSRRVSNIVEVRVLQAPAETTVPPASAPSCAGGPSDSLTVDGWVSTPTTYDADDLAALPQRTVSDTYLAGSGTTSANYTGVDLWRLLGLSETDGGLGTLVRPGSPGPQAPQPQRNDLTRYAVMVTATDCFQAVFSLAEISPFFGGTPVVVATAQGAYAPGDTTPVTGSLGSGGFARISVPKDQRGSRRVSAITEIRVLRAPTPDVVWDQPAPVPAGTALGAEQLDATATCDGATVPGTFTYDPPAGTVLEPGTHTLSGLFVPTQPSSVTLARGTVSLTVLPPPVATELAATATPTVVAGRPATTSARLTSAGAPVAGEPLLLVARRGSSVSRVTTVTTDADGTASATVHPLSRTSYEWRYAGDDERWPVTLPATTVQVRTALTLTVSTGPVRAGRPVVARGEATPSQAGRVVVVRTAQRTVGRAVLDASGRFRVESTSLPVGPHRVYATIGATPGNLAGQSAGRSVRVVR